MYNYDVINQALILEHASSLIFLLLYLNVNCYYGIMKSKNHVTILYLVKTIHLIYEYRKCLLNRMRCLFFI